MRRTIRENDPRLTQTDIWEIGRLDAHDQAALLESGELTPLELVTAAISRIEQLDPALNALSHRAFDLGRERASKLCETSGLQGVPHLLKDSLDYPGMPSRCGSRATTDTPYVCSGYDYARRLDAARLVPLGKTRVPEFSLLPSTEPMFAAAVCNPWSRSHSPGGSSGGAAVAVASGMVPLAHASDGGGSIRIPASCCGVFGLKPGRGRNLRARPHHVVEDLLVADTLLSRTVRDADWAFRIAVPDGSAVPELETDTTRGLRIAVVMNNLFEEAPHWDVAQMVRRTADLCASLGHSVEEVVLPIDGAEVSNSFRTLWGYIAAEIVHRGSREYPGRPLEEIFEPWTLSLAAWAQRLGAADIEKVFEQSARSSAALGGFFEGYDVYLSPVLKSPPVQLGRLAPTRPFETLMRDMFEYVSYTPLQNLTGLPAMSVPLFVSSTGLPIGSMFTAPRGGEVTLLHLAYQLEAACPWANRWPLLSRA